MEDKKEHCDDEDVPSDFFDDFDKEEFMEGLSVIDSWDESDTYKKRGSRINTKAIESVKDLRELIRDGREDSKNERDRNRRDDSRLQFSNKLDDFIKPGSRRDLNKTNQAIKRDKEVKVKEYLAKHLDSSDDLRPPGTELDDYFDETKSFESKKFEVLVKEEEIETSARDVHWSVGREKERHSPNRNRKRSPKRSLRRSPRRTPRRSPRRSPRRLSPRRHISPRHAGWHNQHQNHNRFQPRAFSPIRKFGNRQNSLPYKNHRSPRSPRRFSPKRSPQWERHSRSPHYQNEARDSFLYPKRSASPSYRSDTRADIFPRAPEPYPSHNEYPESTPGYSYPQGPTYSGGTLVAYSTSYDYGIQAGPPELATIPQPVPAPVLNPSFNPVPPVAMASVPMPTDPIIANSLVPQATTLVVSPTVQHMDSKTTDESHHDALAQLLAEGKISAEDYLKLAPNKGKSPRFHGANTTLDLKSRVDVINRSLSALTKLNQIHVPYRLLMNTSVIGPDWKALPPVYCSPLKKELSVQFYYTNSAAAAETPQRNKQLVDCVISTLDLDNVMARHKKNPAKNMKDATCQTTNSYCDVCEIRNATSYHDAFTATEPEFFTSTVHTQVVEQDLVNSKAVFNPCGSVSDAAPISIAHLTPAQLVSQLAARAKTLKQPDPSSTSADYVRRPNNYDFHSRGGGRQQYQNYNYRY